MTTTGGRPVVLIDGQKLRRIRQKRDMSQSELARQTGIYQTRFSDWEKKSGPTEVKLDEARRVVSALDTTLEDLAPDLTRSVRELPARPAIATEPVIAAVQPASGPTPYTHVLTFGSVPALVGPLVADGTVLPVPCFLVDDPARAGAVRVKHVEEPLFELVQPGEYAVVRFDADWSPGRVHLVHLDGQRRLVFVRSVDPDTERLTYANGEGRNRTVPMDKIERIGVVVGWVPGGARPAP